MISRRIIRHVIRYLIRKSDIHIALTVLFVGLGLGWCIDNPTEIPRLLMQIKEVVALSVHEIQSMIAMI